MPPSPYRRRRFDVDVVIELAPCGCIELPRADDGTTLFALFGNRDYVPYEGIGWSDFDAVRQFERECIDLIQGASDFDEAMCDVDETIYENFDWPALDLGVAGAVYALSAAGCLCGASCNGGAFGGAHAENHPLIVFLAVDRDVDILRAAAAKAGAGLQRTEGVLLLYADTIDALVAFGPALERLHTGGR